MEELQSTISRRRNSPPTRRSAENTKSPLLDFLKKVIIYILSWGITLRTLLKYNIKYYILRQFSEKSPIIYWIYPRGSCIMGFLVGGRDWDAVTQCWGLALAAGSVAALYQQQLNTKEGYSVGFPWGLLFQLSSKTPPKIRYSCIPCSSEQGSFACLSSSQSETVGRW